MIPQRMVELLRVTAADLRRGEAPLGHSFLSENEVTLDEAYDLADWLAVGCDTLLELRSTPDGRRLIGLAIGSAALGGTS